MVFIVYNVNKETRNIVYTGDINHMSLWKILDACNDDSALQIDGKHCLQQMVKWSLCKQKEVEKFTFWMKPLVKVLETKLDNNIVYNRWTEQTKKTNRRKFCYHRTVETERATSFTVQTKSNRSRAVLTTPSHKTHIHITISSSIPGYELPQPLDSRSIEQ